MLECPSRGDISGSPALLPRLEYSAGLLAGAAGRIEGALEALRAGPGGPDGREEAYLFCLEALSLAGARLSGVSGVSDMPGALPCAVSLVRAASARLHRELPGCSRGLSGLSVHLGSLALDSAALTGARFDLGRSNSESASLLDKAKLTARSKLRERTPSAGSPGAPDA